MSYVEVDAKHCRHCGASMLRWEVYTIAGVVVAKKWHCEAKGCTALRSGCWLPKDGDGIVST